MNKNTKQKAKEKATKLALEHNLALISRGKEVFTMDKTGKTTKLSSSTDRKLIWKDALGKLEGKFKPDKEDDKAKDCSSVDGSCIEIYADGGSRGNPGPSASGYVIYDSEGKILEEGGEYLGITTNNQAEYQAVKLALQKADKFNPNTIKFFLDSLLVVNQMKGIYKVKNRDLWPVHQEIKNLASQYEEVTFTHVVRSKNKEADAQVNKILDQRQEQGE